MQLFKFRRASLRPASTYDRSAPILTPRTFSSSQSSSTSASPPDHTHFSILSQTTEPRGLFISDDTHPQASESIHEPPSHHSSKGDVFQDPLVSDERGLQDSETESPELQDSEVGVRELQTINRQTIASLTGGNIVENKSGSESDSDQESDGSLQPPSHLFGRSSLDKDSDFEVLAASGSGEDWLLL